MKSLDLKSFLKSTKGQAIKEVLFHIALSIVFVATFCAYWLGDFTEPLRGFILTFCLIAFSAFIFWLIAMCFLAVKNSRYVHFYMIGIVVAGIIASSVPYIIMCNPR